MEDPVKVALDNLELIVANMTTIMKNVPNVELLTKIQVSGEAGKALKALSTLRTALAGGNVSEVKEDQGPDPDRPAINMQEAIVIRNMNSARIKRAVFDINNARNILSSIIKSKCCIHIIETAIPYICTPTTNS